MKTKFKVKCAIENFIARLPRHTLSKREIDMLTDEVYRAFELESKEDDLLYRLACLVREKQKENREIRIYHIDGRVYIDVMKYDRVCTVAFESCEDIYEVMDGVKSLLFRNGHCGHFRPRVSDAERALVLEYRAASVAAQDAMRTFLKKMRRTRNE